MTEEELVIFDILTAVSLRIDGLSNFVEWTGIGRPGIAALSGYRERLASGSVLMAGQAGVLLISLLVC
jgi:hypothetical protein